MIFVSTQVYANAKPAIYFLNGTNYSEISYSSYFPEGVEQSDLSYYYYEGRLEIEMRVSEKDAPMEIKMKQTDREYSILINSPGVYKIPVSCFESEKIHTDFRRGDGSHHALEIPPIKKPEYLDLYPPLSKPESGGSQR